MRQVGTKGVGQFHIRMDKESAGMEGVNKEKARQCKSSSYAHLIQAIQGRCGITKSKADFPHSFLIARYHCTGLGSLLFCRDKVPHS